MLWLNLYMIVLSAVASVVPPSLNLAIPAPNPFAVQSVRDSSHHPVILELFTSEGCSSCPPADALLKHLDDSGQLDGTEIIAIEEHVDYWDHQGWTDPFSSHDWTARQEHYSETFRRNGVYTPQLVVNGHSELVGSDERGVRTAIADAARTSAIELNIDSVNLSNKAVEVTIHLQPAGALPKSAQLWLAVTERGLASDVQRGENEGRHLPHASVLRSLKQLNAKSLADGASFTAKTSIDARWKPENLRFVVFLQDSATLSILGAAASSASPPQH